MTIGHSFTQAVRLIYRKSPKKGRFITVLAPPLSFRQLGSKRTFEKEYSP